MHIKYVINQHHCDNIKDYPHVDHYIKNISTFNTLNLVYGFFFKKICDKEHKLFTLPCWQPSLNKS